MSAALLRAGETLHELRTLLGVFRVSKLGKFALFWSFEVFLWRRENKMHVCLLFESVTKPEPVRQTGRLLLESSLVRLGVVVRQVVQALYSLDV